MLDGLTPGETIAVAGIYVLEEGQEAPGVELGMAGQHIALVVKQTGRYTGGGQLICRKRGPVRSHAALYAPWTSKQRTKRTAPSSPST